MKYVVFLGVALFVAIICYSSNVVLMNYAENVGFDYVANGVNEYCDSGVRW